MLPRFSAFFVLLLCTALSLNAATVQYSARQDIPTGFQHLTGLAIADFNGDGFPDLAVTDDYANKIVVYLNNGKGGFGAPVVTTLSGTGYGGLGPLVTGDVNEDGKLDLIVSPVAGLQYDIVLLGNGDGTFTQGQILSSTYGFINGTLVDVNGDKHLDLVSGGNPAIAVELGDGKGNFRDVPLPGDYGLSFNTGLATGDFNGDGYLDILTAAYNSGTVQFTAGNGDGTFQPPSPVLSFSEGFGLTLSSGDFNRDGKPDFVLSGVDFSAVFLNRGNATFPATLDQAESLIINPSTSVPSSNNPPISTAADLDGNGAVDIAVADDNALQLSVFLNDGTGTFSQLTPNFAAPLDLGSGAIQTADLNGDGLPDIIVTNYITQNISIFLSIAPKLTPTFGVQSSAAQALVGTPVTVSVQVKGSGTVLPTGTVSLANGSNSLGQQALDATGTATFTLPQLAVGQYSLVATYSGDKTFAAGSAAAFAQAVTDFQVTLPSATQTVKAGASATYPLDLSALAGFSGPLSLSCTGLPAGYTCTPATVALNGQTSTVNLVVTPASTTAQVGQQPKPSTVGRSVLACILLGLCLYTRKRRVPVLAACLTVALCGAALVGCSSGSSGPKPYTGTSTFTITAVATQGSQTDSHEVMATLIVQ